MQRRFLEAFFIRVRRWRILQNHNINLLQMADQSEKRQEGQVSYEPPSRNTTLVESLREQPSFLMEQYNQSKKQADEAKGIKRAGGVYVPPHKLRQLQQQMMEADPSSETHQKLMWELLRKSINGIVNKVNIANIQNVVVELFNENIYRGRGLLARSIIKAQMASPNFTHVYAALIAVINTKVPEVGLLIARRVIIQFRRSFERNNKIVCVATTRMIAHLVNQRVVGQYLALQILLILLLTPTEDSVEIACDFMIQVGQVLAEITPAGSTTIFQRFKSLLHQAQIGQKAQYSIENLFAVRKTGFKEHPGVIPELDLVEPEDQITHQLDIEQEISGEEGLNLFKRDPNYLETEEEWEQIKMDILGQQNIARLKEVEEYEEEFDEAPEEEGIRDLTEQDLINLRKTIYLAIQSTVNFEQCAHKILKLNIAKGYEHQLVDMILECCMMERIYQSFFGFLAERFCTVDEKYKELFIEAFLNRYNNIFKEQANKIRNLAHLFAHLFYRKALDWKIFQAIRLTPESTTAAARMFLKIFLKDIAQNMGINNLAQQFQKQEMRQYYEGLFPIGNPNDLRFAINYYTAIGLGKLTEQMRQVLALQEQILNERKRKEEEAMAQQLLQEEEEMMKLVMDQQRMKEEEQRIKEEEIIKAQQNRKEKNRKRSRSRSRSNESRNHRHKRQRRKEDREEEDYQNRRLKQKQRRQRQRSEIQRQRDLERQQRKQLEKERQEQQEQEKQQKKQREQREREKERQERQRRKRQDLKKRGRSRDRSKDRRQRSATPKRRRNRSQTPKRKVTERGGKKKNVRQSSSSSGISSSSDSSSSSSSVVAKPVPKKNASDSSISGSSSDSSSVEQSSESRARVSSSSD